MTKAAWSAKKKDIQTLRAGMTRRRYVYHISVAAYQKDWGNQYADPASGARFLGFLFRLIPKIRAFQSLLVQSSASRRREAVPHQPR